MSPLIRGGHRIKLVLIRHPETNNIARLPGRQDAPSPKGLEQLSNIEKVCRKEGVQEVVYSTMPRAAVSGDLLAGMLDVPATPKEGLKERDFGKWESWEWPHISVELAKLSLEDRYTFRPPDGETWQEMEMRLRATLLSIAELHCDSVAVMTHAGPLRVILSILKLKTRDATTKFTPGLGTCLVEDFDPTSV